MGSTAATNWIALATLMFAMMVQAVAIGWWLSRKMASHESFITRAVAAERDARSRSISEHAKAVAVSIDQARSEASLAREQVMGVRIEIANAFRDYPTKAEIRQILDDRFEVFNGVLSQLLVKGPTIRRKSQ